MATVRELLAEGLERLRASGSESARLDTELLLAHALDTDRTAILAHPEAPVGDGATERYRAALGRRETGEPVAFIRGFKEFHGLAFGVDERALIPRPETEGLAERAVAALRRSPVARPIALDVGTGSGVIAVTLAAEVPAARVVATDISSGALRVARGNAARHGVGNRVLPVCCGLLSALKCGVRFVVVVSNPPYIAEGEWPLLPPEVRDHEPPGALLAGRDGLSVLRPLVEGAAGLLSHGGELWCEIGASQGEAASSLPCGSLRPLGVFPDLAGRDRYVGWEKPERER